MVAAFPFLFATLLFAGYGCKSAPREVKQTYFKKLHEVSFFDLMIRRPLWRGADPDAGPGGSDYRSDPLPDERLDCRPARELLADIGLDDVQRCLAGVNQAVTVVYRLERDPVPFLYLDDPEDAPACLRERVEKIPVPREIFFFSNEEGRLRCYSSRLNVEANSLLSLKLPIKKVGVRIDFPLEQPPKNSDQTAWLLFSWILTPFWGDEKGALRAKVVPDSICRTCFTEKAMITPSDPPPVLWPKTAPSHAPRAR
jgi:hypothetical protein